MDPIVYSYQFSDFVTNEDIESTLILAVMGIESLYGESLFRLDAVHELDKETRQCTIDATTDVGRALNRLFAGYLMREFPRDAFEVRRSPVGRASASI
jgi:hypothetical protein